MDEQVDYPEIVSLPNEVLSIILLNNNNRDILNFGATCKHFHTLVSNNHYLWKEKFKVTLPTQIFEIVEKYGDGDWLMELKHYFDLKHAVYKELLSMSPKYYWRSNEISMREVKNFFYMALWHNKNYYYVVYILQDLLKTANELIDLNYSERPYTMTEIYYAKIVLRFLVQTYLAIKWYQNHMRGTLSAEFVVNFFVQWIDTATVHDDADVETAIQTLVDQVEKMFPNAEAEENYTVKERVSKGVLHHKDVLLAISDVIYHQNYIALMPSANIESLDILQVLKSKCGHSITVAAIYQAVASRCGVKCDLIAFPNHLFLEWRASDSLIVKIDLESGTIIPKGRCPFSRAPINDDIRYCPDTFLQYIVASFLMTMGALSDWTTRNAVCLQDFMSTVPDGDNPYKNYREYLMDYDRLPAMRIPLVTEFLDDSHRKIMEYLVKITHNPVPINRMELVKPHDGRVRFAVGMLCYHQKHDYLCVIRGWDLTCCSNAGRRMESSASDSVNQPFYYVLAVDMSDRYIAQDNLINVSRPNRLYHLEDTIAKDFTHFDGFSYVPNAEKEKEYPSDGAIVSVYKTHYELKNLNRDQAEA